MRIARLHLGLRQAMIFATLLACGAFAVWPLDATHVQTPVISPPEVATKQVAALDLAAFRVPLWVAEPAPPPPPEPVVAVTPPPPLNLQLLAIVREGQVYKAAVYDPDLDRILVVAAGEKVGTRSVQRVDKATMTLRDETGERVLLLKAGGEGT